MPADPRCPIVVVRDKDDKENENRTKRTWDLPTDRAEFLAYLLKTGETVAQFNRRPVYRGNADSFPWLRDLTDEDQFRATRFTLRGCRGDNIVDLTWTYSGVLSGDEEAAAIVRTLAEAEDGQPVGTLGGSYTTHKHLESPYSAYALVRRVFSGGRPKRWKAGFRHCHRQAPFDEYPYPNTCGRESAWSGTKYEEPSRLTVRRRGDQVSRGASHRLCH